MDDFLHNLRTGKNKPFDRNRKQFENNNYKNPDRQNVNDNRRREPFQRIPSTDHLPAIIKLLEVISESQKRLVEIEDRRSATEERMAAILENLTASTDIFKNRITEYSACSDEPDSLPDTRTEEVSVESDRTVEPSGIHMDRDKVIEMIVSMRNEQLSYEKIARNLEMQGISTFSGRGSWHSQTISKLCQQLGISAQSSPGSE